MSGSVFVLLLTMARFGQSNTGELRLTVVDASGLPLQSGVELVSETLVHGMGRPTTHGR